MTYGEIYLILADDDKDDCLLFQDVLVELSLPVHFTVVHNGEELMQELCTSSKQIPDVLFLDLNMPRKNGFQCLSEIKENGALKDIPVIIFSTSFESGMVKQLYQNGARYYIRKPGDFSQLKDVIHRALLLVADKENSQPTLERFVLSSEIN